MLLQGSPLCPGLPFPAPPFPGAGAVLWHRPPTLVTANVLLKVRDRAENGSCLQPSGAWVWTRPPSSQGRPGPYWPLPGRATSTRFPTCEMGVAVRGGPVVLPPGCSLLPARRDSERQAWKGKGALHVEMPQEMGAGWAGWPVITCHGGGLISFPSQPRPCRWRQVSGGCWAWPSALEGSEPPHSPRQWVGAPRRGT